MLLIGLFLLGGCGAPDSGKYPLAGTVSLDGVPLDRGTIEFHPVTAGTITGGTIREGKFDIPAAQGAMPGSYEVRIYSTDLEGTAVPDPEAPPGPESARPAKPELIAKRYNVESELEIEVEDGGNTELDFQLTK
ncbi:hypothetical protein [Roseimaritima multifibrata]|uniref:hypothetical protein n=1 Tax=Roseimaritima multifibrata TaxID=1930274 RepID=UPI0011A2CB33|nr:hypothetical protein [Roseimaritima multifibrata]